MNSIEQIVTRWQRWQQSPQDDRLLTGELLQTARTLSHDELSHLSPEIYEFIRLSDEWEWEQEAKLLSRSAVNSQPFSQQPAPNRHSELSQDQNPNQNQAPNQSPEVKQFSSGKQTSGSNRQEYHRSPTQSSSSTTELIAAIHAVGTHLSRQHSVPEDTADRLYRAVEGARERGYVALGMGGIEALAISPNNQWAAVACEQGMVVLLDRAGRVRHQWQAYEFAEVRSVAFGPNGQMVATGGSDGSVSLWSLEGQPIGSQHFHHEGAVLSVAISPEGDRVASSGTDLVVHIWPVDSYDNAHHPALALTMEREVGTERTYGHHKFGPQPGENHEGVRAHNVQTLIRALQFEPMGHWLVGGGSDGQVYLWDGRTGQLEHSFDTRMGAITSLSLDRNSERLVCGSRDGELWVQSMVTGIQNRWQAATQPITAAIPLPDDQIVTGSGETGGVQWDRSGHIYRRLQGENPDAITAAAVSPCGKWMVCGTRSGMVRLWDLRELSEEATQRGHHPDREAHAVTKHPTDRWQHWLHVACDRLQYHPALNETQSAVARGASRVCSLYGYQDLGGTISLHH